jgi:hypothetical protein
MKPIFRRLTTERADRDSPEWDNLVDVCTAIVYTIFVCPGTPRALCAFTRDEMKER